MAKYLDQNGVNIIWQKTKNKFVSKGEKVGSATTADASHKIYDYGNKSKQIEIGWSGPEATTPEHFAVFINNGSKIKDLSIDNAKVALGINEKANVNHYHSIDYIDGLRDELNSKASPDDVDQLMTQVTTGLETKISKSQLTFSLSGTTLTITQKY